MTLPKDNSRYFFYAAFTLVLLAALKIAAPLAGAITLAFLTAGIFNPIYQYILKFCRGNVTLASLGSLVSVVLIVLLPLLLVVQLTVQQLIQFSVDIREYTETHEVNVETGVRYVNEIIETLPLNQEPLTVEQAQETIEQTVVNAARVMVDQVVRTGMGTVDILAQGFTYLFLLFFLFPLQRKIPQALARLSPLDNRLTETFVNKAEAMAQSMLRGTVVIAIVQGAAGGLLLSLFGVPYVMFWMLMMIFFGIIPMVGATTVLIPAGGLLLLFGQVWQGIAVLVISLIVISNIDNIMRPYLVPKEAELHPAVLLIGVIGGLKLFGLLGVVYGPVVMILLMTMLSVFEQQKIGFEVPVVPERKAVSKSNHKRNTPA